MSPWREMPTMYWQAIVTRNLVVFQQGEDVAFVWPYGCQSDRAERQCTGKQMRIPLPPFYMCTTLAAQHSCAPLSHCYDLAAMLPRHLQRSPFVHAVKLLACLAHKGHRQQCTARALVYPTSPGQLRPCQQFGAGWTSVREYMALSKAHRLAFRPATLRDDMFTSSLTGLSCKVAWLSIAPSDNLPTL